MAESFDDPVLRQWKDDNALAHHAAEAYARVQELRNKADYYETALLRYLKHEMGLTWGQVAEVVNANLGSRQAARQKWQRLVSDDEYGHRRRKAGSPGSWPRGKPRRSGDMTD